MFFNLIITVIFSINVFAALIFMMACAISGRQSQGEQDVPPPPHRSVLSRNYANSSVNASAAAHA
ncbi:MAG: hypothetical protein R3A44_37910 [Caldilineaceae bacterium]